MIHDVLGLSPLERKFLNSLMGNIDPTNPAYLAFAERYLATYLNGKLITDAAKVMIERLHFKVTSLVVDTELEKILSEDWSMLAPKSSTKSRSYTLTKATLGDVQRVLYETLTAAEKPLSRRELSHRTGVRLQSVCARVNELICSGLVKTQGTEFDKDTNREVETIVAA